MRIEAVKSFVTLVQTGSYPSAAEALFLSPTTVHGHVKGIEEEVKATLVVFNGRQLELTRAGMRYFHFAERILDEHGKMERDISGLMRRDPERLRLACLTGPSVHLVPPVVHAFRQLHPQVTFAVTATGLGECQGALSAGEADVVIVNEMHTVDLSQLFDEMHLCDDELVLVIRKELYEPPDVALLERYPLAMQGKSSVYRNYVERWARREGIAIHTVFEHTAFDGLLAFAMVSDCVAMMGDYMARSGPLASYVHCLDLPDFGLKRQIVGIYRKNPEPLVEEFLTFFRSYYSRLE